MDPITFGLGVYGATLSSYLVYLTYRAERPRVGIFFRLEALEGPPALAVYAVNRGRRPVEIIEAGFVVDGGVVGLPPVSKVALPRRLEDGGEIAFRYEFRTLPDDLDGFMLRDSHRRTHSSRFSPDFASQMLLFRRMLSR